MKTILLLGFLAAAQTPPEPATLTTRTRSVALFKNGFAFHVREALWSGGATLVDLEPLPVPCHGTFWIATNPERVALVEAIAHREKVPEEGEAVDLEDLLRANVGREVLVYLPDPVKGTLVRVTEPPEEEPAPMGALRAGARRPPASELVVLKVGGSEVAIPRASIQRMGSVEGALNTKVARSREALRLRLRLGPRAGGASPVVVSYLALGTSWAPSYAVDLGDPGRARITAKAEVFCEAEDLVETTLYFVTGFPNLKFRDITAPTALRGGLADFLAALNRGDEGRPDQSQVLRQVASNTAGFEEGGIFAATDSPVAGAGEEDLFFYERKGVTLKKGERAYLPLFTAAVPFEHVYEWRVSDTPASAEKPEVVWHSVRLTNDSGSPWTTAPAMTVKNDRVLGQDILGYTAPGARTVLRITQALDLRAKAEEVEKERVRNAATFHRATYDLVTVQGEWKVTNHKSEPVVVEASRTFLGEVVEAPPEAVTTVLAEGLRQVNARVRMEVRIPVKPKETATIRFVYRVYIQG